MGKVPLKSNTFFRRFLFFAGASLVVVLGLALLFVEQITVDSEPQRADNRSYTQIVLAESPREALLKLQDDINWHTYIADDCHPLAHEIGRVAFEKYQSYEEAAKYQQSVCNSGYIHGVIERRLAGVKDLSTELAALCTGSFKSYYDEWQCFHGIGHGVMYYTNNNLPLALQYCLSLKDQSHQSQCANGVYMENFVSENKFHPSQFVKDSEPFYPCTDSGFPFPHECIYYAPTRMLNNFDYQAVYQQCDSLNSDFRLTCVRGVAGQAMKDNYSDMEYIDKLCSKLAAGDQQDCVKAMLSMYVNMKGSVIGVEHICESLQGNFRASCFEELEQKKQELAYL